MINLIALVTFYLIFCTGCAVSVLVKDCKEVQDDSKYVCKTIKPWE